MQTFQRGGAPNVRPQARGAGQHLLQQAHALCQAHKLLTKYGANDAVVSKRARRRSVQVEQHIRLLTPPPRRPAR